MVKQLSYRRHLPHYQPAGATLFVTFRLYGSIPGEILGELHQAAHSTAKALSQLSESQRKERNLMAYKRIFARWEDALHLANSGPCWLEKENIARIVADALHKLDGDRYDLLAYCIMPNHVHVVFTPLKIKGSDLYHSLPVILQSIKGFTARQANMILGRKGKFWQEESYDHVIRDEKELEGVIGYVVQNPVKAGLVQSPEEWKWTYSKW